MIILVAVLAILLLISIVVGFHLLKKGKEALSTAEYLKRACEYERREGQEYRRKFNNLNKELAELKSSNSQELKPESEDEKGSFIRTHSIKRASPETYRNVFDLDVNGQRVLDDLQLVFASKSTYVRGGHDAERESCFRAGQTSVVGHIFKQINKANNPSYKEEVNES